MNNQIWIKKTFREKDIPAWECPTCKSGILKLDENKFNIKQTIESINAKKLENWTPEYITYLFNGFLTCPVCDENISFTGKGYVEEDVFDDHSEDNTYFKFYTPEYFCPPLHIFTIVEKCPYDVRNEIILSFNHFWNDLPACANRIRSSLELIMNQQKIKKYTIYKHRRKALTLHKRIELFKLKDPEVANFLLAIKWIGNSGSHIRELKTTDLIDAYSLLELSLNKLYDDNVKKLKTISNEIIKRKGLRKRK